MNSLKIPFIIASICILTGSLHAQISPGKLSKYHVALEGISNCTKCHELGKSATEEKCLACHEPLKKRIDTGKGFHSSAKVKKTTCVRCHSEHHGIDYELVFWSDGRNKFDHSATGFPLEGSHSALDCEKCHREQFNYSISATESVNPQRTFFGLSKSCISCHIDEHVGQLNGECLSCHTMTSWKPPTGFDHDSTRYPLTGRHREVDCQKCHQLCQRHDSLLTNKLVLKGDDRKFARYDGLNFPNCSSCHEDVHKGKLGADCAGCHNTTGFRQIASGLFDHSKTDFPLDGKHLTVACDKCHKSDRKSSGMVFGTCKDCHSDRHKGEFTSRTDRGACEACHSVEGFSRVNFRLKEHQASRFPLTGGHLATPCIDCHQPMNNEDRNVLRYSFDTLECSTCHRDPHRGEASNWMVNNACQTCHSTNSWREITFDHSRTKFELSGKHQSISCGSCHKQAGLEEKYVPLKKIAADCLNCHQEPHQQQFAGNDAATDCIACHTPAGWSWLKFNHDRDSRFKLEGAHKNTQCSRCHRAETGNDGKLFIRFKPLSTTCSDCHGKK